MGRQTATSSLLFPDPSKHLCASISSLRSLILRTMTALCYREQRPCLFLPPLKQLHSPRQDLYIIQHLIPSPPILYFHSPAPPPLSNPTAPPQPNPLPSPKNHTKNERTNPPTPTPPKIHNKKNVYQRPNPMALRLRPLQRPDPVRPESRPRAMRVRHEPARRHRSDHVPCVPRSVPGGGGVRGCGGITSGRACGTGWWCRMRVGRCGGEGMEGGEEGRKVRGIRCLGRVEEVLR